ncbi:unnamed protein product [Notodromas monacha]|uniref:EGF-like domain-containing protein n=1 Tax=Notodromas monacha TaxID=399045 RepID=A0A7R9BP06_9CRUS|nr:unnamed protein product [Notodromas monacha]CAG0918166.1 unnamed protein product [Notodromas monacha]
MTTPVVFRDPYESNFSDEARLVCMLLQLAIVSLGYSYCVVVQLAQGKKFAQFLEDRVNFLNAVPTERNKFVQWKALFAIAIFLNVWSFSMYYHMVVLTIYAWTFAEECKNCLQTIHEKLQNYFFAGKLDSETESELARTYFALSEFFERFAEAFGRFFAALHATLFVVFLVCIYVFISRLSTIKGSDDSVNEMIIYGGLTIVYLSPFLMLNNTAQDITDLDEAIKAKIVRGRESWQHFRTSDSRLDRILLQQPIQISAHGYFKLGREMMTQMLGLILTYLIIVLQLNEDQPKSCCMGCKSGLIVAKGGMNCTSFKFTAGSVFGPIWSNAQYKCCQEMQDAAGNVGVWTGNKHESYSSNTSSSSNNNNAGRRRAVQRVSVQVPADNACEKYPRQLCQHICVPIGDSGFKCECYSGFSLAVDDKSCIKNASDVSGRRLTCEDDFCEQICTLTTPGNTVTCSCEAGFVIGPDGQSCFGNLINVA